jgi:NADH-quinone oxidoreductase subunit H
MDWLHSHPEIAALVRAALWVIPILLALIPAIWFERRLLAWMQDRVGPNRVGPFGLLQPVADITKLMFKEEIIPSAVDRFTYVLAPLLTLIPPIMLGAAVPFGEGWVYPSLTPVADINIGILYLLGVSSLGVYGLVLAGYSGNNKYALMGGLRASAQLISYELAMGMSLACIVMASGSLKLTDIVKAQELPIWGIDRSAALGFIQNWNVFTPFGFVAAIVFFICMFAETNRPPFDLPEAENELIAGYHIEYSSAKFVSFLMGEYFAMLVFGSIFATVFLGGYNLLPLDYTELANRGAPGLWNALSWASTYLAPLWLFGKIAFGVFTYIWVRATLPRLRYDQLMNLGWKALLPAATFNLVIVGLWIVVSETYGPLKGMGITIATMAVILVIYLNIVSAGRQKRDTLASRTVTMVDVPAERKVAAVEPVPVEATP